MKRFLLIPSCALLALGALTSCQKEEKSALELAQELTTELQKVTDYTTAEAVAPRVQVLNKRLQDASVRTVTLNSSALLRSVQGEDKGAAYAEALVKLAREMGRVRSSVPVTSHDGEVDRDLLVMATGVAAGTEQTAAGTARMIAGQKFMEHDADKSHENPPTFEECYGSAKLKEALAYVANPSAAPIMKFDSEEDVVAIPEPVEAEAEAAPSADEVAAAADGGSSSSSSDDDDTATDDTGDDDTTSTDDDTTTTTTDDDDDIDISLDGDDDTTPTTDDTSDDTTDITIDDDTDTTDTTDDTSTDDTGDDGGDLDLDIDI